MRSAAALLGLSVFSALAAPPFSVEQILSSAFPSELTAAPKGNRVAWLMNDRGVRGVYVAEAPGYAPRALTQYKGDDGQDLTSLAWTPDGETVLYTRGGPANRGGEAPNPASDPRGADQAVYAVSTSGGDPRRLGSGDQAFALPSGERACWLNRGQVWCGSLAGEAKPSQLFKARGAIGGVVASPDGKKLAFHSQRGDHAFVGVYEFSTQMVRYLDASTDFDTSPAWSPDSRKLVYRRTPYDRQPLPYSTRRAAKPWSLRVADVETGQAREVFRASEGPGSVFQSAAATPLFWLNTGHIVFPWEKSGWMLLYAIRETGGLPICLTPGAFEVEEVTLAADGQTLVFNSNQNDIERRHIWKVSPGSAVTPLTQGTGIEWNPALLADGKTLAYVHSSAKDPARVNVAGKDITAPPSGFPVSLVEPEAVEFPSTDGMPIRAILFRPPELAPGKRAPAIVHFHGGSRRQMLLGWHYRPYYHNAYGINQLLAAQGFLVITVNYRSGTGYGMEFREALNYGANGASEFQDVLAAGLYLRNRADVDPKRVGIWGGSYGGFLTAMGLSRASHLFAAGVDLHGVHDWNHGITGQGPDYDPSAPDRVAFARRAWESSPMSSIDGWRSPVLLIHGDDDRNVVFNDTVRLSAELRKRKVEVEHLIFPDEVHDFLLHANWLRAMEATVDFFNRRLAPSR